MAFFQITTPAAPTDPNSYTLVASAPTCTGAKNHVCYIIAANDGLNRPAITQSIIVDIITGLNTKTDQTNAKLKP